MKKLIASIIILLIATTISFAQNEDTTIVETSVVKENVVVSKDDSASISMSAKILKINRKKNTEIISIKSYRKSLHIKVKTIRMC